MPSVAQVHPEQKSTTNPGLPLNEDSFVLQTYELFSSTRTAFPFFDKSSN